MAHGALLPCRPGPAGPKAPALLERLVLRGLAVAEFVGQVVITSRAEGDRDWLIRRIFPVPAMNAWKRCSQRARCGGLAIGLLIGLRVPARRTVWFRVELDVHRAGCLP